MVRTSGEVPWVAGTLLWLGPHTAAYDVLGGRIGEPVPTGDRTVPLNLRPGAGRLLAFTAGPLQQLALEVRPSELIRPALPMNVGRPPEARTRGHSGSDRRTLAAPGSIIAGQSLRAAVHLLGRDGRPIPGSFPLELRVSVAGDRIPGLARSFSAQSGQSVQIHTALSDPAGKWTLSVTDGISGLSASQSVQVARPEAMVEAPEFAAWGWPSEIEEPATVSQRRFVSRLEALGRLYLKDHSQDGWMTKQRLGYFYDFFPDTRHALLRPLVEVDWRLFANAIRQSVQKGATLALTGEDMGVHPGSGLTIHPHFDARPFEAIAGALADAVWSVATPDGETAAAALGRGRVILCRESIDASGHDNRSVALWQKRWLAELDAGREQGKPLAAPSAEKLRRWWMGAEPITDQQRTVTWLEGNVRDLELSLSADQSRTFGCVIPPQGRVRRAELRAQASGQGTIRFDIGCDLICDSTLPADGQPVDLNWSAGIARIAQAAAYRDDNGWRIIPIRVRADGDVKLTLGDVQIAVE
jgi:hypothetical protein